MHVQFFDDPADRPRNREDVRFNQLGLYMHPDGRRLAVGFDITPFVERPSILVNITNAAGEEAASLTIIETLQPSFSVTLHLRDQQPTDIYEVEVVLYYRSLDGERLVVDRRTRQLDATVEGEQ